jgi:membrane protein required for colicin V production
MLVFIGVLVVVRYALVALLRHLFGAGNPERREADRLLGPGDGRLKALGFAYVLVCALVFAEQNIIVAGKRFGLSPKDSVAFSRRGASTSSTCPVTSVKGLDAGGPGEQGPGAGAAPREGPFLQGPAGGPPLQAGAHGPAGARGGGARDYQALIREDAMLQLLRTRSSSPA